MKSHSTELLRASIAGAGSWLEHRSSDVGTWVQAPGSFCELGQSHPLAGPGFSYLYTNSEGYWEDEMKQDCERIWCTLKLSTKVKKLSLLLLVPQGFCIHILGAP